MKTKLFAFGILALLSVGLAWLLAENRALHARLQENERNSAPRPLMRRETRLVAPAVQPGQTETVEQTAAAVMSAQIRDRWANPDWRAARFDEAYLQVEARYGRFFQHLQGWSPERVEALKRQLADQSVAMLRVATTTFPADGATASLGEAINQVRANNEVQLKATLTDEEYRDYEETERMETNRETVSNIMNTLRARGVVLDPVQEEAVLRTYANTLHEFATGASASPLPQVPRDQAADAHSQQIEAFNGGLMRQMSTVLTETQLKSFMEAYLEQQGGN
jgi:hypothetical protein